VRVTSVNSFRAIPDLKWLEVKPTHRYWLSRQYQSKSFNQAFGIKGNKRTPRDLFHVSGTECVAYPKSNHDTNQVLHVFVTGSIQRNVPMCVREVHTKFRVFFQKCCYSQHLTVYISLLSCVYRQILMLWFLLEHISVSAKA